MSEKILEIKDERLSFFTPAGEVKALNGVSFSMNQGDVLGIVGESGSGKSVTAYSIMGLTAYPGRLVGGTVWFNGHQIDKMTEKEFRKIRGNEVSIIFQDPMTSLNPVYTIGNQIVEVIRLHCALNGDREHRLPGNVNFCFEGIEGESMLLLLDGKGICASSGSACTSGSLDPSHVLLAIGRPHEVAHGSLRLSLCEWNSDEDADRILDAVPEVVSYLRGMSPMWKDLVSGRKSFIL